MPAKAHRPGMVRTHSRTSSGGSSKAGLNLQFTQKDPPPPRTGDKAKKSSHMHHEPIARVASAHLMRSNSGVRVHSRENIAAAVRRAPTPNAAAKHNGATAKQKVDFSISSPEEEGDDDEWVSSESGAATPNNESDQEPTPIEQAQKRLVALAAPSKSSQQLNASVGHDVATPKAAPPSLPRVDTARQLPVTPTVRPVSAQEQNTGSESAARPTQEDHLRPQVEIQISSATPPVSKARSETHSPPRRSPDIDNARKRQSMTRPPSTHSITSPVTLRPHPLIRGNSYGQGALAPPGLAPLATVLPDSASGQLTTASNSPTSLRAASPTSIRTVSGSPNLSSPASSQAHRQLRRTSTSSVASSATMPVGPSASEKVGRSNHDRNRTMSTISSSSSIAALTNFTLRSAPSPTRTPIMITSHFPPQDQNATLETIHPLLPPPYLSAHLTVLAYRNPIAESYDRVIRAKHRR
ncbi:uncharacterized protein BXZ73DRAFT_41112 [Epithele typhae]|uniref:uncharacterized protein n=1 Tax=Epithele typhae TaxID=378194 RepID=UPI002007B62D|nr:uncharacterized protein BXZ73DRAFT_41112 [Epithele typhae]KAH9942331.1 hypothetical protein BXZ73DRAFT_41112 [Epithele typhae]